MPISSLMKSASSSSKSVIVLTDKFGLATTPTSIEMSSSMYYGRLQKEYKAILNNPPENIEAHPSPSNIREWHYVVHGPKDTPYEGGIYHGKLLFPVEYPMKGPSITMITPSGRFKPDTRLCLSMSDFHPETWNVLWSVSSILIGLLSFMVEETPTLGSVECSATRRRQLAAQSMQFNLANPTFCKMFPTLVEQAKARSASSSSSSTSTSATTSTSTTSTTSVATQAQAQVANAMRGNASSVPLIDIATYVVLALIAFYVGDYFGLFSRL